MHPLWNLVFLSLSGYYFLATKTPGHKVSQRNTLTKRHWNIICIYSDLTKTELKNAPKKVRDYFKSLPLEYIEKVEITDEILILATKYIEEKVVGQTSFDDCVHIATATINKADILVSWNFKHIVNVYRIRGYNSVNLKMNYPSLEIRSPKEIIEYED